MDKLTGRIAAGIILAFAAIWLFVDGMNRMGS
jgi:hypothetical protein